MNLALDGDGVGVALAVPRNTHLALRCVALVVALVDQSFRCVRLVRWLLGVALVLAAYYLSVKICKWGRLDELAAPTCEAELCEGTCPWICKKLFWLLVWRCSYDSTPVQLAMMIYAVLIVPYRLCSWWAILLAPALALFSPLSGSSPQMTWAGWWLAWAGCGIHQRAVRHLWGRHLHDCGEVHLHTCSMAAWLICFVTFGWGMEALIKLALGRKMPYSPHLLPSDIHGDSPVLLVVAHVFGAEIETLAGWGPTATEPSGRASSSSDAAAIAAGTAAATAIAAIVVALFAATAYTTYLLGGVRLGPFSVRRDVRLGGAWSCVAEAGAALAAAALALVAHNESVCLAAADPSGSSAPSIAPWAFGALLVPVRH